MTASTRIWMTALATLLAAVAQPDDILQRGGVALAQHFVEPRVFINHAVQEVPHVDADFLQQRGDQAGARAGDAGDDEGGLAGLGLRCQAGWPADKKARVQQPGVVHVSSRPLLPIVSGSI